MPDLERAIRQAILDFEPRILPESLQVARARDGQRWTTTTSSACEISGQLWAQPLPLELLLRTEIDLETGQVEVADLAPSRVT